MAPDQQFIQTFIHSMITLYKVEIRFKQGVLDEDFQEYAKGDIIKIFKAIISRFKTNATPHHVSREWLLHDELLGAVKIRLLNEGIRIVYRIAAELPTHTVIDIYAVGPRKGELAYQIAAKRKDW